MKKQQIIAIALAAGMTFMGAGYAAWTDSVTINNSITTGNMEVVFDDEGIYPNIGTTDWTDKNYVKATIAQENKKLTTVNITNLYPGSEAYYEAKIKNEGSIPAVFDESNSIVTLTGNTDLQDEIWFSIGITHHDKNGTEIKTDGRYAYGYSLNDFKTKLDEALDGLKLEPQEYITFDIPSNVNRENMPEFAQNGDNCVIFYLDKDAEDNVEGKSVGLNMNIDWKQHNIN